MKRLRFSCALLGFGAVLALVGCGARTTEVTGTVTLDGKPVEGAMVTFTSDDGVNIATGLTDASGKFELQNGNTKGTMPGVYNAVVTKVASLGNVVSPSDIAAAGGNPNTGGYLKQMEKNMKEQGGAQTKGPPMPMMPGAATGPKTLLPQIYASPGTTPFKNIKIPADAPIKLDLTSAGSGPPGPGGPPGAGGKK